VELPRHQLVFEDAGFSLNAIQRAAYRFIDRLTVDVVHEDSRFCCSVRIPPSAEGTAEEVLADFRIEVLDQSLRERIRAETADTRNLILAVAFSNTDLVPPG
jgi:His-Xaa-Ser system protein HxsD